MRSAWLVACLLLIPACSDDRAEQVHSEVSEAIIWVPAGGHAGAEGREWIPAEWTVAEDTSVSGDVTTLSLQLPTAQEIAGLVNQGAPRLALRCVDGQVEAFIDTESFIAEDGLDSSATAQSVRIQLDSAPRCE